MNAQTQTPSAAVQNRVVRNVRTKTANRLLSTQPSGGAENYGGATYTNGYATGTRVCAKSDPNQNEVQVE